MGVSVLRHLHVPGVQRQASRAGRAHQLRQVLSRTLDEHATEQCACAFGKLPEHPPFQRSVSMDSWNPDQLKKMQAGGNGKMNAFFKQYGVDKHVEVREKYNARAAEVVPSPHPVPIHVATLTPLRSSTFQP
jgi:hypothetical protein